MKKNKFADEIIVRLRAETEKREACLPGSPYLIDELIAQFERTESRLTLTEAALSAAVEYVKICESPAMEYAGKEMFEREAWGYKRERDAYYAALDALKP